ncbi:MAG: NAD+ synthase [Gammaproteobacteria bacterium]|nr:NAD+ synthase [Gammaproteobacteria bacterium]
MAPLVLAAAQLKLRVGDVDGNVETLIESAERARDSFGAELVLTPELGLIGYPPDDLLLRSAMPQAIAAGLDRLRCRLRGVAVVVGYPEYAVSGDRRIYNAACVIADGRILARHRKQRLPNYGVFDERRHFTPGQTPTVFELKGRRLGLAICEDVWSPQPIAAAARAGAQLLLAINASPFDLDKSAQRRQVLAARARESGLPIVYVNAVGGQDDLVFDGDSQAVDADGHVGFQAPLFESAVLPVRWDGMRLHGELASPPIEEARVWRALVCAIGDYVRSNGFAGVLVGLSGGIDSALVAALAADAVGGDRLWCVSLPSRYTAAMSNEDARLQAQALGARYSMLPIGEVVDAAEHLLAVEFASRPADLTEENLQSRARGLLLMALSNKFGHLLLATGNKSEMATGYATLYGDMCGGFAPIKDVYKTWVYRLARWRNAQASAPVIPERVLTRAPSAELRPDQTDQDSLPPYEVLDPILAAYVERSRSIAEIVADGYEETTVRRVAALVRRSEYKRRQAPPGPKVTPCAFGRERRYPLTARYGDL